MKPLIFIPGLFGSMGNDIIPGTGKWDFGLAKYTYVPFMERLKAMGYVEGKDLYVCFYDWRRSVKECAERYLIPKIKEVKTQHQQQKVDIIAHSMGGLLARYYVQGSNYEYDIDNLIMIGSPHAGSVIAYYPWEGGTTPPNDSAIGLASYWLLKGYAWLFTKILNSPSPLDTIRRTFPSLQDLLPTKQHPPYLFEYDDQNNKQFIPIEKMHCRNYFLEALNNAVQSIFSKGINVFNITGDGQSTMAYIHVCSTIRSEAADVWPDGQPIKSYTSTEGDGTVLNASSSAISGQRYTFPCSHNVLPVEASHIISRILQAPVSLAHISSKALTSYISVISSGPVTLNLRNIKSAEFSGQAASIGHQTWLFIPNPSAHHIVVDVNGLDSGEYTITVDSTHTPMDQLEEFRSFIESGEVHSISIRIIPFLKQPIIKRLHNR